MSCVTKISNLIMLPQKNHFQGTSMYHDTLDKAIPECSSLKTESNTVAKLRFYYVTEKYKIVLYD